MSLCISQNKISNHVRNEIVRGLSKTIKNTNKNGPPNIHVQWPRITKESRGFSVPIGFAESKLPELLHEISIDNILSIEDVSLEFHLRPEQEIFLRHVLKKDATRVFSQAWSLKPGFGKTITCMAAIKYYNMDTVIVVHRACLLTQWKKEIDMYFKGSSQNIKVVMLSKLGEERNIKLLVIDEAHACMTAKSIYSFANVFPSILIGLSGSFFRYDVNDQYLKWLYGDPITLPNDALALLNKSTSRKILLRTVYSNISPKLEYKNDRLDWNLVLTSLAENEERNKIILNLVNFYVDKKILILVKRVDHGKLLHDLIKDYTTVEMCFGNDQMTPERINARVLIGTSMKIGTGMDIDSLNCIILATDLVNYTIQYVSRILRKKTQDALIIDIIDDNNTLRRHFGERKKVYKELGVFEIK